MTAMASEKPDDADVRELISEEAFEALTDVYIAHPKYCECPSCTSMDELLNEMCIDSSGCRKPSLPGRWGCEDHPHHGPERHAAHA